MAMTTAQGTAAITTAVDEELAEFARLRAGQTQMMDDAAFEVNDTLEARIRARLLVDLDSAWSD